MYGRVTRPLLDFSERGLGTRLSLRTIYNSLNPSLVDDNSEQLDSEQAGHKLSSVDTNTLLTRQMQTRYVLHAYIVVSDSK